ncbi:2-C-methyl-D-erythritol 4-phosphate cytidylyltransferase [Pseudomonas oligotrophica]|uniref:2-C-methyl-D-erythritol 4-phosphate cytidylyltransferase n=1 Tax=Pseudomonas oligotrophica TaxID=2912055 RepID=UPI001F0160EA|nr:2-C-methyl-D-erythritol 4-phosphate cytidylyltransferase [Pseudomonas oligotrophica]MCF7202681.1 2-C-methyl-D-erythritol 4-phosphate cytidylyltransferase [Pseudomonas oligotrophica]
MNHNPTPFWVVIPAAGIGSRMAADRPKQYLQLGQRTILEHTLNCFLGRAGVRGIAVSLASDDPWWPGLACASDPRISRAAGGAERADSVLAGLERLAALGAADDDWVLVHDAARPNLADEDLQRLLDELGDDPVGGLLAVPAKDTLKRVGADGRVEQTVDRRPIWLAYTPQMFRLGMLRAALLGAAQAGAEVTDEASAVEWLGHRPRVVEGRADNIKITRPDDLEWLALRWDSR